jgi:hypothetical protein
MQPAYILSRPANLSIVRRFGVYVLLCTGFSLPPLMPAGQRLTPFLTYQGKQVDSRHICMSILAQANLA